jgi:hypothetical protein
MTNKFAGFFLFVCLCVAALFAGFALGQDAGANGPMGRWSGRATDANSKSFNVTVMLDGSGAGFIEYPSRKCGGSLKLVRRGNTSFSYQERITHGQAACTTGGFVDLAPNGGQMDWTRTAGGTKSTAVLDSDEGTAAPNGCASCEMNYDQSIQSCARSNSTSDDRQKCRSQADDDLRNCEGDCRQ